MSPAMRSRIDLALVGALLVSFFVLVAYLLGPLILKPRTENGLWYGLHIIGGSLVLGLGPFQFVAALRNRFRRYHRVAGYIYIAGSAMAVLGYVGLPKDELFLVSQMVASSLWIVSVFFAVTAIRMGNVRAHQHNMARSLVFAAYFLTARLIDKHGMWLLTPFADSEDVRLVHSDWLAWIVPLVLVEIYFALRTQTKVFAFKRGIK